MTGSNLESVKTTIAKLITLANNEGATENESKVAMERAQKLMAKYGLEEAQVLREKIKTGVNVEVIREYADVFFNGKLYNWEHALGWAIAKIFDCRGIREHKRWDDDMQEYTRPMGFVGMPNDIALVLYFFDYCQTEIGTAMEINYPNGGQRERNSFALGMADKINVRLKELYKRYKEEMKASGCMDLVIYKKDLVLAKYKDFYPHTVKTRSRTAPNWKDYVKGQKAGENVHLSSGLNQLNGR